MPNLQILLEKLQERFAERISTATLALAELTIEVPAEFLHQVCQSLRDDEALQFNLLVDVCGVDYLEYGVTEWETEKTTLTGFSRAVDVSETDHELPWKKPRFAVVYHLLSLTYNWRLRVRTFPVNEPLIVDSVVDIWPAANWYEREVFDLFGILFNAHPDLRRLLTDYGFIGHPFRKDFPLIGYLEMRYDAELQRCVYEPVSIQPRTLVPKVIRLDERYLISKPNAGSNHG